MLIAPWKTHVLVSMSTNYWWQQVKPKSRPPLWTSKLQFVLFVRSCNMQTSLWIHTPTISDNSCNQNQGHFVAMKILLFFRKPFRQPASSRALKRNLFVWLVAWFSFWNPVHGYLFFGERFNCEAFIALALSNVSHACAPFDFKPRVFLFTTAPLCYHNFSLKLCCNSEFGELLQNVLFYFLNGRLKPKLWASSEWLLLLGFAHQEYVSTLRFVNWCRIYQSTSQTDVCSPS